VKEKITKLQKVECVWGDINYDKFIAGVIILDMAKMMDQFKSQNSGIVVEEMKMLHRFTDDTDE